MGIAEHQQKSFFAMFLWQKSSALYSPYFMAYAVSQSMPLEQCETWNRS